MFDFLSDKFSSIFSRLTGKGYLSEDNLQEAIAKVKDALLQADVPYKLVDEFTESIKKELVGKKVVKSLKPGEQFVKVVHDKLLYFLGAQGDEATFILQIPSIVMVMGLQGSGKTTTIAKMAKFVEKQAQKRGKKRKILLASVDFYRPAAVDQLEVLAKQVGVAFYRASSTDPVQASREISDYAKQNRFEIIFLDTAGRLHVDANMLDELKQIDRYAKPKYKVLVLDSMTGQESLSVAKAFDESVPFNSAILTKMDSDTRGGAAFAFRYELQKPISFVGVGEKIEDLEQFRPKRVADRILGMGDILSLVEKAEEKIKQSEQESLHRAFSSGKMNLQDFANQMDMVGRLGSLSKIMKYIPGASGMKISPEMMQKGEVEVKKFKAIISSMTPKERYYPKLLDGSRKQRIAKGAGARVEDVNTLLQRFEQSQQYAKLFKKFGRF
ncbi:signal recognition particle protein [Candidatus Dependentiae bacterium]